MTSTPSFTFFCCYLLLIPLLVGFLFQEESRCSQLLPTLFLMVGLLRTVGVHAEPSLIHTLPGPCGLSSLRDEVQTLPGEWSLFQWLGTLPWVVPVVSAPSEMRCAQSPDGWQGGEETGAVAAREFPKVPQRVFFFLGFVDFFPFLIIQVSVTSLTAK